jgi:diphthine-ammonia ligase
MSLYLKNNKLVKESEWKKTIDKLRTKSRIDDKNIMIDYLKRDLIEGIDKLLPKEKFGILFSGGVDSTLIAYICKYKLKKQFTCYTVGTKDSEDVSWARKIAKHYKFKIKIKIIDEKEAERTIKKTVKLLGNKLTNPVNVGVGSVEVSAIEMAKKDKIKYLFGGLGSEELFAGYQRHELSKDINKECINGLKSMWERDLLRDSKISEHYKIKCLTPFLDEFLIKTAMMIPGEYKIKEEHKKYILRLAAEEIGLMKDFAFRKKRAAQYGSNFDKMLEKIARKKGFKQKSEYLKKLA